MVTKNEKYAHCPPREEPVYEIDQETRDEISEQCRITPLYEKGVYEHIYHKHYSLARNRYLSCAWSEYKKDIETRVYAPFQFPDQRDLHFFNGYVSFKPALTDVKRPTFRKSLKPGPGVDQRGQMPIPNELHMKRGIPFKTGKGKKKKSSKTEKTKKTEKTENTK